MLIALERRRLRARQIHERLHERRIRIGVPWAVLIEWWRGRTDEREDILGTVEVDDPSEAIARLAGETIASVSGPPEDARCRCKLLVDAVVMATAALRGDVVYTQDFEDLSRLAPRFPGVRVFKV
jgi:hypothetical protein